MILVGLVIWTHGQNSKLHDGLTGSCRRVNVLRAQSNVSDLAVWRALSGAAQREYTLAHGPQSKTHKKSAEITVKYAADVAITALTDCNKAVNDPEHYRFPIAGPIGDAKTGKEFPEVAQIERQSKALIKRQKNVLQ